MSWRTRVTWFACGVALVGVTAGCGGDVVCPAVAYGATLTVTAETGAVVVCSEEGCSDDAEPSGGPWLQDADGARYVFTLMDAPTKVDVRLTGDDGAVIAATHRPDWERVGGSARCGGPQEAELDLTG